MTVSATEAAFEGFRITRHNPGAVLIWAAVWLVGLIAAVFATLPFVAPFVQDIIAAQGNPESLSPAAQAGISRAGFAVVPIVLLIQAFVMTAVYRAVLRPSPKGFGYLRIGRDELRMFVVVIARAATARADDLRPRARPACITLRSCIPRGPPWRTLCADCSRRESSWMARPIMA